LGQTKLRLQHQCPRLCPNNPQLVLRTTYKWFGSREVFPERLGTPTQPSGPAPQKCKMEPIVGIVPPKGTNEAEFIRERIISIRRDLGLSSIQLAYLLKQVKEKALYVQWGASSFEEAIADPDISISRSTAYGLLQVWDTWVERYKLSPEEVASVPYDKLLMVAPMVRDDNHEEIFADAKNLSRQDLVHMKLEKKLNKDLPDFRAMPTVWRCKNCGLWCWDARPEEVCKGH